MQVPKRSKNIISTAQTKLNYSQQGQISAGLSTFKYLMTKERLPTKNGEQ